MADKYRDYRHPPRGRPPPYSRGRGRGHRERSPSPRDRDYRRSPIRSPPRHVNRSYPPRPHSPPHMRGRSPPHRHPVPRSSHPPNRDYRRSPPHRNPIRSPPRRTPSPPKSTETIDPDQQMKEILLEKLKTVNISTLQKVFASALREHKCEQCQSAFLSDLELQEHRNSAHSGRNFPEISQDVPRISQPAKTNVIDLNEFVPKPSQEPIIVPKRVSTPPPYFPTIPKPSQTLPTEIHNSTSQPLLLKDEQGPFSIIDFGVTGTFPPVGFKSSRQWHSMRFQNMITWYTNEVIKNSDSSVFFRVTPRDDTNNYIEGPSPEACWNRIVERVSVLNNKRFFINGSEMFGFLHETVKKELEKKTPEKNSEKIPSNFQEIYSSDEEEIVIVTKKPENSKNSQLQNLKEIYPTQILAELEKNKDPNQAAESLERINRRITKLRSAKTDYHDDWSPKRKKKSSVKKKTTESPVKKERRVLEINDDTSSSDESSSELSRSDSIPDLMQLIKESEDVLKLVEASDLNVDQELAAKKEELEKTKQEISQLQKLLQFV